MSLKIYIPLTLIMSSHDQVFFMTEDDPFLKKLIELNVPHCAFTPFIGD